MGKYTPLHFSRFFPHYKLTNINPTPQETLERAKKIALKIGLKYIYIGNIFIQGAENTYCPKCKKLLIGRVGFDITENNMFNGKCKFCKRKTEGIWK